MRDREAEAYASKASAEGDGRNLSRAVIGAETRTATGGETKPEAAQGLLEAALERSNMMRAYQRVVENKGAPGVDGLTVLELKPWLQAHWAKIKTGAVGG
jgi:RNA-directed DNA polymerase